MELTAREEEERYFAALLTAIFGPAEDPEATHSHRCQFDGHVWTHANSNAGNAWAHKCPQCGREEWERYHG